MLQPSARITAGVSILLSSAALFAQGTRADYERAARLRALTAGKVFRDRVTPRWSADGSRFWYVNDLPGGEREFIVVDPATADRRSALDPAKLADALSRATGKETSAEGLRVDRIELLDEANTIRIWSGASAWICSLDTYELREDGRAEAVESVTRLEEIPRATRRTGRETSITFVNRLTDELELFWIDTSGDRKSYGRIAPGVEHRQHTFEGHVWLLVDPDGKVVDAVRAEEHAGTAIVTARRELKPRAERRGRRERREPSRPPDGAWSAFFREDNVYIRHSESGEEVPLSTDGTEDDAYGGRIYWSPDATHFVVLQTKKGDDRKVYYVEPAPRDQVQPKLHSYDYRKPGDRIPLSRPRLFEVTTKKRVPVPETLFPNPWSISDIHWAPGSEEFFFVYNERGHQALRLLAVDAETGTPRVVIDERSETFVDYAHKKFLRYLDRTGEIIWMSERDGWNHLYLYDAETGTVTSRITQGEWVVRGVDRVDQENRQVWFRAGGIRPGQDPYQVHYCRVNLDGTGLTILTDGDGTHSIELSPDRRFFIDTWSRVDSPPVTELRRSEDGGLVCVLERADWSALLETGWTPPERFVAKGRDGETDIYGVIFRPTKFDPHRSYPVVEEIYAGPQGSFVPKGFRALHGPQVLAELGFVVVKIDGMGTSNRSKRFHDVCWKNLGDSGFPDRIRWIRAAAAKYPYMNIERVGIYGGSAGGQSALGALLAHGDFYKVAVADCGCHDNRMDKIWWNELWMGWPVGPHYEEQSNVTQAHKLEGDLLLIVGALDRNVDPASTMQVVDALIRADKDFDLLVIPSTGHGAAETPYGKRRRADFLVRHLLGVEPRSLP